MGYLLQKHDSRALYSYEYYYGTSMPARGPDYGSPSFLNPATSPTGVKQAKEQHQLSLLPPISQKALLLANSCSKIQILVSLTSVGLCLAQPR